jgi:aspartate-semialdehyde dehydrogenase
MIGIHWGLPGWWGSGLFSCWRTIRGLKKCGSWLAASDRSSGKPYGEAVRWKLDTPLPERVAAMPVSPATPVGAPRVIFAALDADIAREMEPRFAAAGCAVITNSSAFRMQPSMPLVIPEVNADHLALVENQSWRRESGGYIVTNPNCSAIGLVLALKPLVERFGVEAIFVCTMQAVSGAGYPGVASLDILGNVVPFIKNEEEKMEAETLKLLGRLNGRVVEPLAAKMSAHCNRVAVEDGHTESVSIKLTKKATREEMIAAWAEFAPLAGQGPADGSGAAGGVCDGGGSAAAAAGQDARRGDGGDGGTAAAVRPAGLEVHGAVAQHDSRGGGRGSAERGAAGVAGQTRSGGRTRMNRLMVMKFGGTSVEDAARFCGRRRLWLGAWVRGCSRWLW